MVRKFPYHIFTNFSFRRYYGREGKLPFVECADGGIRIFKEWYYSTVRDKGSTRDVRAMSDNEIPERFRDVRRALLKKD